MSLHPRPARQVMFETTNLAKLSTCPRRVLNYIALMLRSRHMPYPRTDFSCARYDAVTRPVDPNGSTGMATQAFRVLYTKQLTRKLKTYNDGYLIRDGPRVHLLDDTGMDLATGRLPASLQLTAVSEGVTAFDGYLVDCDEELASATEVPNRSEGGSIRAPQPSEPCGIGHATGPSPSPLAVATPAVSATLAGPRGKFRPPRPADAPPPAASCPAQGARQGWHAADVAQPAMLGKRPHAERQEPPSRGGQHCTALPPPVHRSGESLSMALNIQ